MAMDVAWIRYLNTLPLEQAKRLIGRERPRQAGWKFLLNLKAGQKTLIVEPEGGTLALFLSPQDQDLIVLHKPSTPFQTLQRQTLSGSNPFILASLAHGLPFANKVFDTVLLHHVGALFHSSESDCDFILREGRRVLKEKGTLVVTGKNQSLLLKILSRLRTLIRKSSADANRLASIPSNRVNTLLHHMGLQSDSFALSPSLRTFSEIRALPPFQGIFSSSAWERWRAPAFVIRAAEKPQNDSFLARLEPIVLEQYGGGTLQSQQYRIGNPDTALLIYAIRQKETQGGAVVRLPLTEISRARCQRNWDAIQTLSLAHGFSEKVPHAMGSGELDGQTYFIESRISGRVLTDPPPEDLYRAVDATLPFVTGFHQAFAKRQIVDQPIFNRIASPFFDGLLLFVTPEEAKRLHALRDLLYKRLSGTTLPFVYAHGDFQVENMAFDPDTFDLRGVIDWDLSQPAGLPLLDLLYLFLYAETLRGYGDFETIFCKQFFPLRLNRKERTALEQYQSALGISPDCVVPLLIFFWLHHVVFRLEPTWRHLDRWMKTAFYPVLTHVEEVMKKGAF